MTAKKNQGTVIKYMGMSDIRRLEPGETLLGTAEEPLGERVEWHKDNAHLVHVEDYPDVPKAFWDKLLNFADFQDVSKEYHDEKADVPINEYELHWPVRGGQPHVQALNPSGEGGVASSGGSPSGGTASAPTGGGGPV